MLKEKTLISKHNILRVLAVRWKSNILHHSSKRETNVIFRIRNSVVKDVEFYLLMGAEKYKEMRFDLSEEWKALKKYHFGTEKYHLLAFCYPESDRARPEDSNASSLASRGLLHPIF